MADTQRLPKIKSEDIDNRIALATLGAESMDSSSNGAAATTVGAGRKRKAVGEHEGRPAPPSNTTATTTSATTIAATLAPPNIPDPPRGTLPPLPELQLSLQTMTFRHSGWGPGRDNQVLALQGAAALSLAAVELILEKDFLSLKGALNVRFSTVKHTFPSAPELLPSYALY